MHRKSIYLIVVFLVNISNSLGETLYNGKYDYKDEYSVENIDRELKPYPNKVIFDYKQDTTKQSIVNNEDINILIDYKEGIDIQTGTYTAFTVSSIFSTNLEEKNKTFINNGNIDLNIYKENLIFSLFTLNVLNTTSKLEERNFNFYNYGNINLRYISSFENILNLFYGININNFYNYGNINATLHNESYIKNSFSSLFNLQNVNNFYNYGDINLKTMNVLKKREEYDNIDEKILLFNIFNLVDVKNIYNDAEINFKVANKIEATAEIEDNTSNTSNVFLVTLDKQNETKIKNKGNIKLDVTNEVGIESNSSVFYLSTMGTDKKFIFSSTGILESNQSISNSNLDYIVAFKSSSIDNILEIQDYAIRIDDNIANFDGNIKFTEGSTGIIKTSENSTLHLYAGKKEDGFEYGKFFEMPKLLGTDTGNEYLDFTNIKAPDVEYTIEIEEPTPPIPPIPPTPNTPTTLEEPIIPTAPPKISLNYTPDKNNTTRLGNLADISARNILNTKRLIKKKLNSEELIEETYENKDYMNLPFTMVSYDFNMYNSKENNNSYNTNTINNLTGIIIKNNTNSPKTDNLFGATINYSHITTDFKNLFDKDKIVDNSLGISIFFKQNLLGSFLALQAINTFYFNDADYTIGSDNFKNTSFTMLNNEFSLSLPMNIMKFKKNFTFAIHPEIAYLAQFNTDNRFSSQNQALSSIYMKNAINHKLYFGVDAIIAGKFISSEKFKTLFGFTISGIYYPKFDFNTFTTYQYIDNHKTVEIQNLFNDFIVSTNLNLDFVMGKKDTFSILVNTNIDYSLHFIGVSAAIDFKFKF